MSDEADDAEGADAGSSPEQDAAYASTLRAYEYAKREQLATEGAESLRRELAGLVRFLASGDDPYLQNVDVDVGFRQAKARILRKLLAEAQAEEDTEPS